ncbi:hypothetical protein KL930_002228 [Ogataea haglerorum]|uniref:Mitochondrial transcription factor 1 n=1 Tax=Ogataea haglerorum TaxID=1937702 RepID=A0AAN6D6X4_9ASCO|nr:uncharacterized protein KL911_000168 [Ogataea haglerorum]KAG7710027.1 hypothetical protein KL914_000937 [Ogataea haglerorum]KAG7728644.1 hypothetical protein KL933_001877 [Ogataea haglerorum]KAG7733958.1 hypothetical protein KL948_001160 [Ogataea haglerorum]KAG7740855.1 hypothetical protein KL923_001496 [Ogataea haglerorum]KAG7743998.1 hypothetical protein KL932_001321 [Ogataea haglerorum]
MSKVVTRAQFVNSVETFKQAYESTHFGRSSTKIPFSQETNHEIFEKLDLKNQYKDPSEKLHIVDYNTGFNSFVYDLNHYLHPRFHLLIPNSAAMHRFWKRLHDNDPLCRNFYLFQEDPRSLRHYNSEELINSGKIVLDRNPAEKVNQTLLITGSYITTSDKSKVRSMLYFNQMRLAWYKYPKVKSLFWLRPADALKYLGIMGSRFRQTNSVVATAFGEVNVIAYSNFEKQKSVTRCMRQYPNAIELPKMPQHEDLMLVEFQSNQDKYKIEHMPEFTLVLHKLFMLPSYKVVQNLHFLGPGADEYFKQVLPASVLECRICDLPIEELVEISNLYFRWPFKPMTDLELYLESDKDHT